MSSYLDRVQCRLLAVWCVYLHPQKVLDLHTAHHPPGCCPADPSHPTRSTTRSWSADRLHTSPPWAQIHSTEYLHVSEHIFIFSVFKLEQRIQSWSSSWEFIQNPASKLFLFFYFFFPTEQSTTASFLWSPAACQSNKMLQARKKKYVGVCREG